MANRENSTVNHRIQEWESRANATLAAPEKPHARGSARGRERTPVARARRVDEAPAAEPAQAQQVQQQLASAVQEQQILKQVQGQSKSQSQSRKQACWRLGRRMAQLALLAGLAVATYYLAAYAVHSCLQVDSCARFAGEIPLPLEIPMQITWPQFGLDWDWEAISSGVWQYTSRPRSIYLYLELQAPKVSEDVRQWMQKFRSYPPHF